MFNNAPMMMNNGGMVNPMMNGGGMVNPMMNNSGMVNPMMNSGGMGNPMMNNSMSGNQRRGRCILNSTLNISFYYLYFVKIKF